MTCIVLNFDAVTQTPAAAVAERTHNLRDRSNSGEPK